MSPSTVGMTMADCPSWLQPRVKAAAEAALRSLRPAEVSVEDGGLLAHHVRIHGLTGRPDLNGQTGWVSRHFEDKGRYQTEVFNDDRELVLLRPANLEVILDLEDGSEVQTLVTVHMTLLQTARRSLAAEWLDAIQMGVCTRQRRNGTLLRVTHDMNNEDRHPGRCAQLGLPPVEELLDDLAQNEMLLQLFVEVDRSKG